MKKKTTYGFIILLLISMSSIAQNKKKVSFVGGARSLITNNRIGVTDSIPDTTTVERNTGGYALIDLGVDIRPNENTEILGMFRIRNDYGGFWGAGVTFDVRQLWVKGIIAKKVRYQLGDINLKQTPFTLFNHQADRIDGLAEIFSLQNGVVDYEKFYRNNTWRQQGANVNFALNFNKYIQEIDFDGYVIRLGATDFGSIPDRLMAGGTIGLKVNDKLYVGLNQASAFDVLGTVADSNTFHNNVTTAVAKYTTTIQDNELTVKGEIGRSALYQTQDTLAPSLNDYFINLSAKINVPNIKTSFELGYLNVGPDFRSVGAQSKDINYSLRPTLYNQYTNNQNLRPLGLLDVIADDALYNRSINTRLASDNYMYNIVTPYGLATFNRNGIYAKVNHTTKKYELKAESYFLSEIRGMGTTALRTLMQHNINGKLHLNEVLGSKNKFLLHAGINLQSSKRNSDDILSNVDFNRNIITAGIQYELFPKMEILGGLTRLSAKGNEFITERNTYEEATYYNVINFDEQQQLLGGGMKYNFSDNIYLTAFYQRNTFQSNQNADFNLNQFGILYNMTF